MSLLSWLFKSKYERAKEKFLEIPVPADKYSPISRADFLLKLERQIGRFIENIYVLDGVIKPIPEKEMRRYLSVYQNNQKYRKSKYDCDNFSLDLIWHLQNKFGGARGYGEIIVPNHDCLLWYNPDIRLFEVIEAESKEIKRLITNEIYLGIFR